MNTNHIFLPFIITFFIVSLSSITTNAQFLNKDVVWVTGLSGTPGTPSNPYSWSYVDSSIDKDTVINGLKYSLIDTWGGLFAFRENENRVYYKDLDNRLYNADTLERVLYDFNLNLNDTFNLYFLYQDTIEWQVTKIDSTLIGDIYKKRLHLKEITISEYPRETYWIKDIGSLYGPFWMIALSQPTYPSYVAKLYCYSINGKKLYGDCQTVDVNLVKQMDRKIILYQPEIRSIKVNLPACDNCFLDVYSISGIKVLNTEVQCNQYVVIPQLKNGLYVFEIKTSGMRHVEKILIR